MDCCGSARTQGHHKLARSGFAFAPRHPPLTTPHRGHIIKAKYFRGVC